jgi:ABC-2 type transport system permease protein
VSVEPAHGLAAIRLVAGREIVTRVRARSFRVALIITVGAVVAGIVAPHALSSPARPYRVQVMGGLAPPAVDAIRAAGRSVGRSVTITDAATEARARAALRAGRADLVVDGARLLVKRVPTKSNTGTFARFLATTNSSLTLYAGLFATGLSADDARAALSHEPLAVEGVLAPRQDRTAQKAITSVGIIMLFIFIQQYGAWVLNGIVEEKASRVVEVLLSVVSPGELLVGKTIGIGAVALAHGVTVATAALVTSTAIGSPILDGGGSQLILGMVGWFVLAYALYCLLMAMAGSLVARQEEAQNAAFPFMMPLLIGYIVSVSTVFGDSSPPLVTVLSFIPLTAPVSMPARMAAGPVPVVQVVLAVGLMLVAIVLAARLAAAVYERGVLQTRRLRWSDVLHRRGR